MAANLDNYPFRKIIASDRPRRASNAFTFDLTTDLKFSPKDFISYYLPEWTETVYDAMIVAASIEFSDRAIMRRTSVWGRTIDLEISVHDPKHWNSKLVSEPLHRALNFLTGDVWQISFVARKNAHSFGNEPFFDFQQPTKAILAYSNGMDSNAVRGITEAEIGTELVCVRVGGKDESKREKKKRPFTNFPYDVRISSIHNKEPSARSRGFKFATISSIAAYLTNAEKILIPESGQGAIGPSLVTVGNIYPDFRNHPRFTKMMSDFISALFGRSITFDYPRLWSTKGETLKKFSELPNGNEWSKTLSCWRGNNWSSVNGKYRQCGACAACMLRRLSVHAAGLKESAETYVAIDMSSESFENALHPDFKRKGRAFTEYAIAGVLHMQHLADMSKPEYERTLKRHALHLALALESPVEQVLKNLTDLIKRHSNEWDQYLNELGERSFVWNWARN